MRRLAPVSLILLCSTLLTGCGSITGLQDAQSDFGCSVDLSPRCASLSKVHESLDREVRGNEPVTEVQITTEGAPVDKLLLDTPLMIPKRAPEEILRVWIAPYIDSDGDLHAEHVIFTTVRGARWAPETLNVRAMDDYRNKLLEPLKGSK